MSNLPAQEAIASEENPDATDQPGTVVTRGTPRSKTLQVRLTAEEFEEFEEIERAAEAAGLPASTFARQILLSARSAEARAVVIARIRSDLDRLAV